MQMAEGCIISFNGVENIGKQFYAQMANNYLKKLKGDEFIKKFSFPSFTTHKGQKVQEMLRNFKKKDLDLDNYDAYTKSRYKRLIDAMLENYQEYQKYIDMHLFHQNNTAIICGAPQYSILAHGLTLQLEYTDLSEQLKPLTLDNRAICFFLTTPNVDKVITNLQHLNHYKVVNNFYRQIFLSLAHSQNNNLTPVFIEIDFNDVAHISKTCEIIKKSLDSWYNST